jgi:hypothetical protein
LLPFELRYASLLEVACIEGSVMEPLRTAGSNCVSMGGRVVRLGGLSMNIGVAPEFTPGDNCARPGPSLRGPRY